MPWKGEKDPYRIWLSEIILQQTRVEQGLEYYNRFIKKYPTVHTLAAASDTDVFKLWEGLGYYSRCKNLLFSARHIAGSLGGIFPSEYADIISLKGVGAYTASAIASFAFGHPHAVVDGNVSRVLARYFGISTPIDSTEGKKIFAALAGELLDKKDPAIYNQAIMDFGATICKPQLPLCETCVLQAQCDAYAMGKVNELPVKEKKLVKKHRWLYYVLAEYGNKLLVRKRTTKDIWQNLHEFVLLEETAPVDEPELLQKLSVIFGTGNFSDTRISTLFRQQLTHQTIHGTFIKTRLLKPAVPEGYTAVDKKAMGKLAFPRLINTYLEQDPSSTH